MKKFLSLSLATVFLLATCFPVFADANESSFSNSHDDFDLDLNDYIQYTIDLSSEKSSNYISASSEGKNVPANSIDKAIDYVSSLELDDKGYSHILEVCIDELNFYKDEDVILENIPYLYHQQILCSILVPIQDMIFIANMFLFLICVEKQKEQKKILRMQMFGMDGLQAF